MAQMPYIAAIDAGIHQEMRREPTCCTSARIWQRPRTMRLWPPTARIACVLRPFRKQQKSASPIGVAMSGLRPVVELYMAEFMLVAMDQVVNEAPRFRYMSGGQVKVPLVLKAGTDLPPAGRPTHRLAHCFVHGVPDSKWWSPPPPPTPRD